MNRCKKAVCASNKFENTNNELKKEYLKLNIETIKTIMKLVPGYCGCFGTGYPFYALDADFDESLPIIDEQIRYNNELLADLENNGSQWACENCLSENISQMPDLKKICKPCPRVADSLKPRKVINRLPDIDMWFICVDDKVEEAKLALKYMFRILNLQTSDVDPLNTIDEVEQIATDLQNGILPKKFLPLDVHIIEFSKLNELINSVPSTIILAHKQGVAPYLPIHPISLRKDWQYDDTAYNFVLDFLFSLTPFEWNSLLNSKLNYARTIIGKSLTRDELLQVLQLVSPDSVKRRFENPQLKRLYERRVASWNK